MCSTPAPPSTALVAASIWSGTGEVNTSPGQAASSIPRPTNPPWSSSGPPARPAARAAARDERDLALHRSVGPHHDLGVRVVSQQIAVRGLEARQRLLDD